MKTIRENVFETNSSSTHSMTITTSEIINRFFENEIYYDLYDKKFIEPDELLTFYPDCDEYNLTESRREDGIYLADELDYEMFESTLTDLEGKEHTVFSLYGYNI